jgi:hypothetical protein
MNEKYSIIYWKRRRYVLIKHRLFTLKPCFGPFGHCFSIFFTLSIRMKKPETRLRLLFVQNHLIFLKTMKVNADNTTEADTIQAKA